MIQNWELKLPVYTLTHNYSFLPLTILCVYFSHEILYFTLLQVKPKQFKSCTNLFNI